jgi:hypothetical protein
MKKILPLRHDILLYSQTLLLLSDFHTEADATYMFVNQQD